MSTERHAENIESSQTAKTLLKKSFIWRHLAQKKLHESY
jgi:hypothetical protein